MSVTSSPAADHPPRNATYGAIEAGGTKFICAICRGDAPTEPIVETRIATTTPATTLAAVHQFFVEAQSAHGEVSSFGVGAFGPLQLDTQANNFGHLLNTPKPGWSGADLLSPLRTFNKPLALDTDVNAAALAELHATHSNSIINSLAYVTVGTGIGVGAVNQLQPIHGALHPEMGHLLIRRHPQDQFAGCCPFHGDCLEGLAAGPAVQQRWQRALNELPDNHPAYDMLGFYLGQLVMSINLMLASERIVLGGGVMQNRLLLPHIRRHAVALMAGYPGHVTLAERIVSPLLDTRSGLAGAVLLAQRASGTAAPETR